MTDKALKAKLSHLMETISELREKEDAVLEEMLSLVSTGEGIGDKLKRLREAFEEAWFKRYGKPYIWNFAIDMKKAKELLRTLGLQELCDRARTYLSDNDPFILERRHPWFLFARNVNAYAKQALPLGIVLGCEHEPPCVDEGEHTARRRREVMEAF